MKLVYTKTQEPVEIGDEVILRDGEKVVVSYIQEPHKPSSTGRVYVKPKDSGDLNNRPYFPSVIGADWIDREDQ